MPTLTEDVIPSSVEEVARDLVKDLPALVTVDKAAELLMVSTKTVRNWISSGRLRALKTSDGSGRVRVPRLELERLLRTMVF